MKVCIAEKPSVAKDIAEIIGAKQRKDGYYEGNGYQVTWTFGHLCTLKEPHDYFDKWKYWNLRELPMIPSRFGIKLIGDKGVEKQFHVISRLVANCEEVINCGDAGQEGELIQQWVLLKAKCNVPIKRLWISSLTEEAITEGFKKLRDNSEFKRLYAAGSSRAIGDWLLGMNATRLFTLKYGNGKGVLSIGRVQTPTLAMIVNRQKEIEAFVPEDYWEVKTVYRNTEFSSNLGKLKEQQKADEAILQIKELPFEIVSFEVKEGKESSPRLFDLTALQVEGNKKFGFSADDTLKHIQSLYEKKLVTYPRVDTTYLSDDIYPKIPGILKGLTYLSQLTTPLLDKPIKKTKQLFDNKKVTDHHAIIPTGINPSGITPDEQKIYLTVAKRFIAAFYPDCIVSNTTVLGQVGEIEFKATGKQILKPGWRSVYEGEKIEKADDKEEDDDKLMPTFEKGESGPHEPVIIQRQTSPPKPYTEATLLRAMETAGRQIDDEELREMLKDNGIGRPSTRANIIETLFRRKYIERKRKNLIATETGVHVIDTISNDLLKSPELTGDWEKKLRLIEKGEYDSEVFKQELIEMVVDLTNEILFPDVFKLQKAIRELGNIDCPKCKKGKILKGNKAYGCSEFKEGCTFRVPIELKGQLIDTEELNQLITTKTLTKMIDEVNLSLSFDENFSLIHT
jgi:DNA topoisomerase III